MALDDGHLMFDTLEKERIIKSDISAVKFIRETTGGKEFIYDKKRWCLWIEDNELPEALKVELIKKIAAGGAIEDPSTYFKENPKDKKKFIKILCKVEGTKFEENKEVKDVNIRIQDVELVVNEVLGVNLEVKI